MPTLVFSVTKRKTVETDEENMQRVIEGMIAVNGWKLESVDGQHVVGMCERCLHPIMLARDMSDAAAEAMWRGLLQKKLCRICLDASTTNLVTLP